MAYPGLVAENSVVNAPNSTDEYTLTGIIALSAWDILLAGTNQVIFHDKDANGRILWYSNDSATLHKESFTSGIFVPSRTLYITTDTGNITRVSLKYRAIGVSTPAYGGNRKTT